MEKKFISILIPDGESDFSLKALRCLALIPNFKITVLSQYQWDPIRFSRRHSGFYYHNHAEFDEGRLEFIMALAKKLKPDIILPIEHHTIRLLSAYRAEIEKIAVLPPLASPETMDLAGNKWTLTNVLKKENIPFPTTVFIDEHTPLPEQELKQLTYPVLAKPLSSAGGSGIVFFDNYHDLHAYLVGKDRPHKVIVQAFIQGYDVGCSVLCVNGKIKAYTIQKGLTPGKKRFQPPTTVEFIQDAEIYTNVDKMMRALNWSGVANIDLRYDQAKNIHQVLEINPRFWASVLASVVAGINFPFLACQLALKKDFEMPTYQLVRYTKPEAVVGLLLKKYLQGDDTVRTIKETGLLYTIPDLGPEIAKYPRKILEQLTDR